MRLTYWLYQGTAHYGVGRITNSMRGVQAVFHAPQGDDYVNTIFTMLERTPDLPRMHTSVVRGRDLAQGTINLPKTLQQVEASKKPDLIVVSPSCSTILLQEDLQRVAKSAELHTDVLVYEANPYRMEEIAAAEGLFTLLVKRYADEQPRTATPSVNLIGFASLGFHARSDLISLRRMLETLGVTVNVVAPWGADVSDLARLPAAWVTVAPYRELGREAAAYLEETFGVPALYDIPIGVKPTVSWLQHLVTLLNNVGKTHGSSASVAMPPLTAFSLDGLSTPSSVPWFTRTADMESFSSKQAFVFGDATHTVGLVKFLHDELGMEITGAGTYVTEEAEWLRAQLIDYVPENALLITNQFQAVANRIEELLPDLVCGTQMERHSSRKLDVPCMVISSPTHIENNLLGYYPILGFAGADVLADRVYTSTKLGMEKHLIDMFGDAGLDYDEQAPAIPAQPVMPNTSAQTASSLPHVPTVPTIPNNSSGSKITITHAIDSGFGSAAVPPFTTTDKRKHMIRRVLRPLTRLVNVPMPDDTAVYTVSERITTHMDMNDTHQSNTNETTAMPAPTADGVLVWTADAEATLNKIPKFVRGKVRKNTEAFARDNGYSTITAEILRQAKEAIGG